MATLVAAATFREVGNAATTQNLFTLENTHATKLVKIRRVVCQMDVTAVLTAVMPQIKTSRCAVPTGGTTLSKVLFDSTLSSDAAVIARGSTASDGGANSGPTATPSTVCWQQFGMRLHTAVGQVLALDCDQLPILVDTYDFVLRQNEAIVVHIVAAAGTSNPATNHYFVNVVWEEV